MAQNLYIIRPARRDEAGRVVEFHRNSSDGIADYIWSRLAGPGENPLDVARRRYGREDACFSYRNCTVVETAGRLVAALVACANGIDTGIAGNDPVLAPYGELREKGSYHICTLAVDPLHRDHGLARDLLIEAEEACRRHDFTRLSLVVFEEDARARRFYESQGFTETARRAIVPHPLIRHSGGAALLMVKELSLRH